MNKGRCESHLFSPKKNPQQTAGFNALAVFFMRPQATIKSAQKEV
jgi:hypothetical protein